MSKKLKQIEERVASLEDAYISRSQSDTAVLIRLKEDWGDYVQFMEEKYGEDFKWTCPYLKRIDKILGRKVFMGSTNSNYEYNKHQ